MGRPLALLLACILLLAHCRPREEAAREEAAREKARPLTAEWLVGKGAERTIAQGLEPVRASGCGCRATGLAIDDNQKRVVFASGGERSRLWEVDGRSGARKAITEPEDEAANDVSPVVRRDGVLFFLRQQPDRDSWPTESDVVCRSPRSNKGDQRLTEDGGDKSSLRVLPGGRFLLWIATPRRRGSSTGPRSEVMLADLNDGSMRQLGPRISWSWEPVAVSPTGDRVAVLSNDQTCDVCGLFENGLTIARVFELPGGKQIAALAGSIAHIAFSPDGRSLRLANRTDLLFIDGKRAALPDSRGGSMLAFDLATRKLHRQGPFSADHNLALLSSGSVHFYRDKRVSLRDAAGKEIRLLQSVESWSMAEDGSAFIVYQGGKNEKGKITAIKLPVPAKTKIPPSSIGGELPARLTRRQADLAPEPKPGAIPTCRVLGEPRVLYRAPDRHLADDKVAWATTDSAVAFVYRAPKELVAGWETEPGKLSEATWQPPKNRPKAYRDIRWLDAAGLHQSVAWLSGRPVIAWSDGKNTLIAQASEPRLAPRTVAGIYSAATLAASDQSLALAWLEGDRVLASLIDPESLALSQKRVAIERASASLLIGEPDALHVVGIEKTPCHDDGPGCIRPVLATLGTDGSVGQARELMQGSSGGMEMPIISAANGEVVAYVDRTLVLLDRSGARHLPVPAGLGYMLDVRAIARGTPGTALGAVAHPRGYSRHDQPAFVFTQERTGIPICRHRSSISGWPLASIALRADNDGIDLFLLAYKDRGPGVMVQQERIAWQASTKTGQ